MFEFVAMMCVPLVPCHGFPAYSPALFLSVHALKDPDLAHQTMRQTECYYTRQSGPTRYGVAVIREDANAKEEPFTAFIFSEI